MKKVLVLGLGKSGVSAVKLLAGICELSAWDSKQEDAFDKGLLDELRGLGAKLIFGAFPADESWDELILSPGVPTDLPEVKAAAEAGARLSGELELAFESTEAEFLAVTGTNGKTTTTALLGEMMKETGRKTFVVGNIGLPVTSVCAKAKAGDCMVTEVSSFQLETASEFKPSVSAILNITPDHLNRHHTMEEYIRVKHLVHANQDDCQYFVFNADDPVLADSVAKLDIVPKLVPFSHKLGRDALWDLGRGSGCYATVEDGEIIIRAGGKDIALCRVEELQIPGTHNLENALAAAACAYFGGAGAEAISRALRRFKGVEHRIEFVRELDGVHYVNDSKGTNPDSTEKALEATEAPILLIAGGYDKGSDFDELAKLFPGKVEYLLLLGKTAPKVEASALKAGFPADHIVSCADLEECVRQGRRLASPGATVLLSPACASWDMYKSFEERGEHFKSIVSKL